MESLEKKQNKTLVLFDFDGTLANTNPLIIESFNKVFTNNFPNIEINKKMELSYIGPTLHFTFKKYLELDDVDTYVNEYRDINMQMQRDSLSELDNATSLLKRLKNNNVVMGIVSSKMKDSLMLGINILEFDKYLDVIIGGDEVSIPKPSPEGILKAKDLVLSDAEKCYYVGDTVTDVQAAKAARFISIAIVTTKSFEADIIKAKPDYIIYNLDEVMTIIEEDEHEKI